MVYIEKKQNPLENELAGAIAFKALKDFIQQQEKTNQPIVTPTSRESIQQLIKSEIESSNITSTNDLRHTAEQAALSYFAREYEG